MLRAKARTDQTREKKCLESFTRFLLHMTLLFKNVAMLNMSMQHCYSIYLYITENKQKLTHPFIPTFIQESSLENHMFCFGDSLCQERLQMMYGSFFSFKP